MKRQLGKIAGAFFVLVLATGAATRAQTFTTLHSFDGTGGANPYAGLVQATDGNFYGTTYHGGASSASCPYPNGCGTLFEITPSGTLTTLYSFCLQSGCTDGALPFAGGLVQATDGNFYGTTSVATVFKISPAGTLTTLYIFCSEINCTDGNEPLAGLVQGNDGNFYATTAGGGATNDGTVFKITPSGTLTTLYSFCSQSGCSDGRVPEAGLIQATDGNFYGTTVNGGESHFGPGTVFKITPTGTLTTLHSFTGTDGADPTAALVQATDGNFYGATEFGGAHNAGTVFKITPTGTLTTLYSFCSQAGCTDGEELAAGVVQASDGNFYGTTVLGGAHNAGTVFKITPTGTLTTLYSFCSQAGCTDGADPIGRLVQATNGIFYGTTASGGTSSACPAVQNLSGGCGTVFSLSVAPAITTISPTSAVAGGAAFALTVNGTNFVNSSAVSFNGNARATTFVSSTQLTVAILASDIATAGNFNVIVTNPGGATSNAVSFTVVTPQQATGAITNSVNALLSQGVINGGQDNSLLAQLQHAITLMNAGKNSGAIGNLDSFISEVNDLLASGVLSPAQAALLVNAAQSVIATL